MTDRTAHIKTICEAFALPLVRVTPHSIILESEEDEPDPIVGPVDRCISTTHFIALCICELAKYQWYYSTARESSQRVLYVIRLDIPGECDCTEFIEYDPTDLESTQSAQLAAIAQACAWIKKAGE